MPPRWKKTERSEKITQISLTDLTTNKQQQQQQEVYCSKHINVYSNYIFNVITYNFQSFLDNILQWLIFIICLIWSSGYSLTNNLPGDGCSILSTEYTFSQLLSIMFAIYTQLNSLSIKCKSVAWTVDNIVSKMERERLSWWNNSYLPLI